MLFVPKISIFTIRQDLFPSSFLSTKCSLTRPKLFSFILRLVSFHTSLILFHLCCCVVDTEEGFTGFLYVHVQNGKNFSKTAGMLNGILLEN